MRLIIVLALFLPVLTHAESFKPFEPGEGLTVRIISARRITNRELIAYERQMPERRKHPSYITDGQWVEITDNVYIALKSYYEIYPDHGEAAEDRTKYFENGVQVANPNPFGLPKYISLRETDRVHIPISLQNQPKSFAGEESKAQQLTFTATELNRIYDKIVSVGPDEQEPGIYFSIKNYSYRAKSHKDQRHKSGYAKEALPLDQRNPQWEDRLFIPLSETESYSQRYLFAARGYEFYDDDMGTRDLNGSPAEIIVEVSFARNKDQDS